MCCNFGLHGVLKCITSLDSCVNVIFIFSERRTKIVNHFKFNTFLFYLVFFFFFNYDVNIVFVYFGLNFD